MAKNTPLTVSTRERMGRKKPVDQVTVAKPTLSILRYSEDKDGNVRVDPLGTLDKHGFPLPASSLPPTPQVKAAEAAAAQAAAKARAAEQEKQRKDAIRAGFKR